MKPRASVIIPTWNRRAMVGEAIASVLAQRDPCFELIVVDDGSSDGTWQELLDLARRSNGSGRPRIRVDRICHRGPAAARNHGLEMAEGEFTAFLDSDDLWAPEKLSRQVAFMRRHRGCLIAQTREIWLRNGRRVNPGRRHLKRAGDIFVDSLRTCLISPSAVMASTAMLREMGGFDERMAACEDYDLWLRVLVDHEVGLLDEPLVTRRAGHPDQLSASIPALDRFRIAALLKLLATGRLSPPRRAAAAEVLAEKCAIYSGGLRRRASHEAADYYEGLATRAATEWHERPADSLHDAISVVIAQLDASGVAPRAPMEPRPR